jgi:ABC-type branched-subunit amino acid transport system ATPase component
VPAVTATVGLEVSDLTIRYGGTVAVDGVSLEAPLGRVTGLIGPNGAGKTTTFNACSGLLRPSRGHIRLKGREVTRWGPAARGRLGLGRTFQRMELFPSMTVRENVALGREARLAGTRPWYQLVSSPLQRRSIASSTDSALELCGLAGLADAKVGPLPTGQKRLVELARSFAGGFDVLLLDEPSSGLDDGETAAFAATLRAMGRERDLAVLLVEHDMGLVRDVCDYIFVLDFGRLLFHGTPAEVHESPVVRAAYLGDTDLDGRPAATGAAGRTG